MSMRFLLLVSALAGAIVWCRSAAAASDTDFVQEAMQNEVGQYDIGLLGQRKGSSPAVKGLGAHLAGEGSAAVEQLRKIASERHIAFAEDAELRAKAQYQDLESRAGRDFDQTLAHDATIDADIAMDTFADEAEHGSDPALRQFAAAELAKLRTDLKMSQDLGG
jgi:putative membrane protein